MGVGMREIRVIVLVPFEAGFVSWWWFFVVFYVFRGGVFVLYIQYTLFSARSN